MTTSQLLLEWEHLTAKLILRSPEQAQQNQQTLRESAEIPAAHPMMRVVPGDVEPWERAEPVRPRA